MARTDYGAILSTVIKDTSDAVREVNGTSSLIAPNQWGTAIRTMHSDSDYENALEQMIEETATGDIASFSDGANNIPCPSVLCTINPVQDLHGQDYPYPSGGGKNKLSYTSGTTETLNGSTMLINADGSCKVTSSGQATGSHFFVYKTLRLPVGSYYLYGLVNGSVWSYDINDKLRLYVGYDNAGYNFGTVLNVTDANKDTIVYIQAKNGFTYNDTVQLMISEGSTAPTKWSPYSNICPITGHTELNLVHTGKNLFDKTAVSNNKWLSTTTGLEENASGYCVSDYIPVKNGQTVFIPTSGTARRWFYDTNKNPVTYLNNSGNQAYTPVASGYIRVSIQITGSTPVSLDTYQIEVSSSATTYEAYTGTTTTTDLGTTVYGGTLEVESGVLTTTHAIIDMGSLSYTKYDVAEGTLFRTQINGAKTTYNVNNLVCSAYYWVLKENRTNGTVSIPDNNGNIDFINDSYSDATAFKTAMTWQTVCYELATPTTIQLTPQEVKSLLGSNNFYHDCNGQVAVTYRANGQLYVEQH